jgi:hypothetical protein
VSGEELSWEEIVNRVTIASNYGKVHESARAWHTALTQTAHLRDSLRELSSRSESWQGSGGNAFRDHVAKLTGALDQTVQSHQRVVTGLSACAGHLETAVKKIPVPSWMYDDVVRMRADYGGGALDSVKPGEFWGGLVKFIRDQVPDSSQLEGALRSGEEHMRLWLSDARAAYQELCAAYARELAGMPRGTVAPVPGVRSGGGPGSLGTPGNAGKTDPAVKSPARPGTAPGVGQNPGQNPVVPPWNSGAGGPGFDPGFNPGLNPGLNPGPGWTGAEPWPSPPPSSGLESGAGLGGAGLGPGGGGIGPGGGAGGIGPSVSLPASALMLGGASMAGGARAAGLGGKGGTGQGSGHSTGGMGMMPVGAGQAGAGTAGRAEADTWLKEDDDYFGPGAPAPDGVLDA